MHSDGAMMQRKEAIKLKEEYHTFRDRSGVVLFAFASVLLVGLLRADAKRQAGEPFSLTPPFMVGVQAFLAWLLYFYTALALRENVLKVRILLVLNFCRSISCARALKVSVLPMLEFASGPTPSVQS